MKPVQDGILIAPSDGLKLTHEESFTAMAMDLADLKVAKEWAETGAGDGLDAADV